MERKDGKNTKWDLFWIIPMIIGSLVLVYSGVHYLFEMVPLRDDLFLKVFDCGLAMCVMYLGYQGSMHGADEINSIHKSRGK